jgi:hypothetical protein
MSMFDKHVISVQDPNQDVNSELEIVAQAKSNDEPAKPNPNGRSHFPQQELYPKDQVLHNFPFLVEKHFYDRADTLRSQFEQRSSSMTLEAGTNPLAYVYSKNTYQLITGMAENLFHPDVLFGLLDRLRAWARPTLGAGYASTPRVQIYISGCWRSIVQDDIKVKWHYILSLTCNSKHNRKIRILSDPGAENSHGKRVMIGKLVNTTLDFNELLVHSASQPYGIADAAASMDPLEGAIFLDGYLW